MSILGSFSSKIRFFALSLLIGFGPHLGYCKGGPNFHLYYHATLGNPSPSVSGSFQPTMSSYSEPKLFADYKYRWKTFLNELAAEAENSKKGSIEKATAFQQTLAQEHTSQEEKLTTLQSIVPKEAVSAHLNVNSGNLPPFMSDPKQYEKKQRLLQAKIARTRSMIPQARELTESSLIQSRLEPAAIEYIRQSLDDAESDTGIFEQLAQKAEYASHAVLQVSVDFVFAKVSSIRNHLSGIAFGPITVIKGKVETLQAIFSNAQFVEQFSTSIMNALTGEGVTLNDLNKYREKATQSFLSCAILLIASAPGDAETQSKIKSALVTELLIDVFMAEAIGPLMGMGGRLAAEFVSPGVGSALADSLLARANVNKSFDIQGKSLNNTAQGIVDSATSGLVKLEQASVKTPHGLRNFANNPLKNTSYTQKVEGQIKQDIYHGFPKEVDNYAGLGKSSKIIGGDGVVRTKIELEGGYNNKDGHFEWIIEPDGRVNHRLFVPNK